MACDTSPSTSYRISGQDQTPFSQPIISAEGQDAVPAEKVQKISKETLHTLTQGRELIRENKLLEAIQLAKELPSSFDQETLYQDILRAYLTEKNNKGALVFVRSIPASSQQNWLYYDIGQAYLSARDYDRALVVANSMSASPVKECLYLEIGRAYLKVEGHYEALAVARSMTASPAQECFYLEIGRAFLEAKDNDGALSVVYSTPSSSQQDWFFLDIGKGYLAQGKRKKALSMATLMSVSQIQKELLQSIATRIVAKNAAKKAPKLAKKCLTPPLQATFLSLVNLEQSRATQQQSEKEDVSPKPFSIAQRILAAETGKNLGSKGPLVPSSKSVSCAASQTVRCAQEEPMDAVFFPSHEVAPPSACTLPRDDVTLEEILMKGKEEGEEKSETK